MAPNDTGLPPDAGGGGGTEAEEAAWEMATAEALRAQGQLADAANWYRRAANHLMEAGEDERAISIAKLAAELAALDDAGRPSARVSSADIEAPPPVAPPPAPPAPAVAARPAPPAAPRPAPSASKSQLPRTAAATTKMPWERKPDGPASRAPAAPATSPSQTPIEVPPWEREGSRRPPAAASPPRQPAPPKPPAPPRPAAHKPPAPPAAAVRAAPAAASAAAPPTASAAPRPYRDDESTTVIETPPRTPPDDTRQIDMGAVPSPLAAMVDEAVSDLPELASTPLASAPGHVSTRAAAQRPSLIYTPARAAEADRIAQRLPVMPLFAELPPEHLDVIARQVGVARLKAGEPLCESGGPEGPMFLLVEGAAYVGLAGSDSPVAMVGAGDVVGEVAALYGGPRTASVIAQDAVEALAFSPSLVRALAREFPSFREAIEETACERMRTSLPLLAPMLRRVPDAQRAALFAQFELRAVDEGTLLLTEGEPVDALYVVAGGEAELYGGEFGVRRTHHARVGEALGVTSLVTGEVAGVTARASRTMLIARLERAHFLEAMAVHSAWADALADVSTPGRGVLC